MTIDNDFIGIDKGIALGYGRVTGADAYGELTRGARIIELYEDQFKFDTWISTPSGREAAYYYPSGLNSDEEQSMAYLPARELLPRSRAWHIPIMKGNVSVLPILPPAIK